MITHNETVKPFLIIFICLFSKSSNKTQDIIYPNSTLANTELHCQYSFKSKKILHKILNNEIGPAVTYNQIH